MYVCCHQINNVGNSLIVLHSVSQGKCGEIMSSLGSEEQGTIQDLKDLNYTLIPDHLYNRYNPIINTFGVSFWELLTLIKPSQLY